MFNILEKIELRFRKKSFNIKTCKFMKKIFEIKEKLKILKEICEFMKYSNFESQILNAKAKKQNLIENMENCEENVKDFRTE